MLKKIILVLLTVFLVACQNPLNLAENSILDDLEFSADSLSRAAVSWPLVSEGSSGVEVKALQYFLKHRGYSISVDGVFGSATEKAVIAFQKSKKLTPDGMVGSATWPQVVVTVRNGDSNQAVRALQTLLNSKRSAGLTVDGIFGSGTLSAVRSFQSAKGLTVDGIAGPATWSALIGSSVSTSDFWGSRVGKWVFPVKGGVYSVHNGVRNFGASRDGGARIHAGIDLRPLSGPGAKVYAMTSGTVTGYYAFYYGTYALQVQNDDGTVVRYAEIISPLRSGKRVTKGQEIGTIIRNTSSYQSYMLHLEVYMGTSTGSLTQSNSYYKYVPSRNYQRRSDLVDPMGVMKLY